jgi:septation ring formation regulator EzrA
MKNIKLYESWKSKMGEKYVRQLSSDMRQKMREILDDANSGKMDEEWFDDEDFRKQAFETIIDTAGMSMEGLKFFKALNPDKETIKKVISSYESKISDAEYVLNDKGLHSHPEVKAILGKLEKYVKNVPRMIKELKAML